MLAPFADLNAGKACPDQITPFYFLTIECVRPFGHPVGIDATRFQPVGPYDADPPHWHGLGWTDRNSGKRYRAESDGEHDDPGAIRLQNYAVYGE